MNCLRLSLCLALLCLAGPLARADDSKILPSPSRVAHSEPETPGFSGQSPINQYATFLWNHRRGLFLAIGSVLAFQAMFLIVLILAGRAHRSARQSIAPSEDGMSLAAASACLGMWAWDIKNDLVWATSEMRRLLSLPADEPLTYQQCLGKFHPMDRPLVERAVQQGIHSRQDYSEEARTVSPGGAVRWLELHGTIKTDEHGQPVQMTGVALDSTARKTAESRLDRQREDLTRLGRINLLGEMTASLSHELGQPLGAAVNSAAAARRLLEQGRIEEAHRSLLDVIEAGLKGGEVLETMKKMAGREKRKRYPIQINQLISETLRLALPDMQNRSVAVEVKLADRLPMIEADPVEIQQVILNLLMNAFDAVAGLPCERKTVVISTRSLPENFAEVDIRDLGAGLSEEARTRLFDRFFSTRENGMGLGLSIARSIIEMHNGTLDTVAEEVGARFRFTLPLRTDRPK